MGSTARLFLYVQEPRTSDSRNCTEYRADNPQKFESSIGFVGRMSALGGLSKSYYMC